MKYYVKECFWVKLQIFNYNNEQKDIITLAKIIGQYKIGIDQKFFESRYNLLNQVWYIIYYQDGKIVAKSKKTY